MHVPIPDEEIELRAIRAQGAGGQNVNKVSSAIHLRFDIRASGALSDEHKARLLALSDRRISADGVLVIKAQEYRSQEQNRLEALRRLAELVDGTARPPRFRKATKPSYGAKQRRLEGKSQRSQIKASRGRVSD
ncbi:MAG: aminoacyl-tRNA hydrolase [Rubrivivax sp.]|nr:MAG: aminoacyl-tRNA hydrolase [Rubrivivax sp.]